MNGIENTKLFAEIIDERNIYTAIYSVESFIADKDLLSIKDREELNKLKDKCNFSYIENIIIKCQEKIKEVLLSNDYFSISVYFRPKKIDKNKIEFRPMHTADLITQISIVSMLNKIIYEDRNDERKLSDLSKIIPHNFYGNIPSTEPEMLFQKWQEKYKQYTDDYMQEYKSCTENSNYLYEISLDLIKFYPSINPCIIYKYILEVLSPKFKNGEEVCLKTLLFKLLYFKIDNIQDSYKYYYLNVEKSNLELIREKKLFYSVGIPQGLPQANYFGNICMIKVSQIFDKELTGKAFYYVDDSVIYSNLDNDSNRKDFREVFNNKIDKINVKLAIIKSKFIKGKRAILVESRMTKNMVKYFLVILLGKFQIVQMKCFQHLSNLMTLRLD